MNREKNPAVLPEGYQELFHIDLQKDRKLMLLVNGIGLGLFAAFALLGHFAFVPVTAMFDMEQGFGMYALRFAVMIAGLVVYLVLHEAVHGVCMWFFSGVKPSFGFNGMYAWAGSTAYFSKVPYLIIALAPIVVWGVVLAVICAVVPPAWFWVPYFIQVANLSGAAGDLYVTARFRKLPDTILVNDTGVAMTVYDRPRQ